MDANALRWLRHRGSGHGSDGSNKEDCDEEDGEYEEEDGESDEVDLEEDDKNLEDDDKDVEARCLPLLSFQ